MPKRRLFGLPLPWGVVVYIFLPVTFFCALSLGVYGDLEHWWSAYPYLTNILTAFTGACIGIPFAVGVIQQIARRQSDDADWSSIIRSLNDNISQIREAVVETYSGSLDELDYFRSLVSFCHDRSEQLIGFAGIFFIDNSDGTRHHRFNKLLAAEAQRFTKDLDELRTATISLLSKSTSSSSITLSAMYVSAWESLDIRVRPRVLEVADTWIPRDSYLRLRQQVGFLWIEDLDLKSAVDVLLENFQIAASGRALVADQRFNDALTSLRVARGNIDGYRIVRRELPEIESLARLAAYR